MFPAPGGLSSMLAFPFPDGGRYQTTSSSSQTNPFGTHPTQLQADIQRQQQAYSPAFQNFQHPYSYGHDPRTESSNDTPFNALRQSTHVPSVPIHIESAFSPHPSWGSLPQQQQSYDRARVTISGWEVDIDPSTVPSSGPSFGEYNPVPTALPPTPVPIGSRFRPGSEGQGKGVEVGRGGWGEEFGEEVRRESTEVAQSTERDIALVCGIRPLQTGL